MQRGAAHRVQVQLSDRRTHELLYAAARHLAHSIGDSLTAHRAAHCAARDIARCSDDALRHAECGGHRSLDGRRRGGRHCITSCECRKEALDAWRRPIHPTACQERRTES